MFKQPISKKRVAGLLVLIGLSLAFAFIFQPKYHGNANALTVLATVFSILAGFLIAVLVVVADDRALRGRNWREDVVYFKLVKLDLERHRALFYLYLLVLSLAFIVAMELPLPWKAEIWLERFLLFAAFFAMFQSFKLPGYVTRRHTEALEKVIKQRQEEQTK